MEQTYRMIIGPDEIHTVQGIILAAEPPRVEVVREIRNGIADALGIPLSSVTIFNVQDSLYQTPVLEFTTYSGDSHPEGESHKPVEKGDI